MNVWEHSLIGRRKFGGKPEDYLAIHRFIDSSKLFYYHIKHRLLLHNLYGVELAVELFGDTIINSGNAHIPVRDIAVEHIREDLDGKIPALNDWLKGDVDKGFSFQLTGLLSKEARVRNLLDHFQFSERWQYSPQKEEIRWLKAVKEGDKSIHNKENKILIQKISSDET
jgi:hypothetical protein